MSKKKETNVLEIIEEQEKKRSKKSSKKNKPKSKKKPAAKKSNQPRKEKITSELPEKIRKHKITARSVIPAKDYPIDAEDIMGTSRAMYVNDAHTKNPQLLAVIYWLRLKDHPHVIVRCSEDDYNWVLDNLNLPEDDHFVSLIDCANWPTISYGWKLKALQGKWIPDMKMVQAYEAKWLKDNPTDFGNIQLNPFIREAQAAEEDTKEDTKEDSEEASEQEELFEILDDEEFILEA